MTTFDQSTADPTAGSAPAEPAADAVEEAKPAKPKRPRQRKRSSRMSRSDVTNVLARRRAMEDASATQLEALGVIYDVSADDVDELTVATLTGKAKNLKTADVLSTIASAEDPVEDALEVAVSAGGIKGLEPAHRLAVKLGADDVDLPSKTLAAVRLVADEAVQVSDDLTAALQIARA